MDERVTPVEAQQRHDTARQPALRTGSCARRNLDFVDQIGIAAQARGNEILVSSVLRELVQSAGDLRFGAARDLELKGISDTQRVFELVWD